jgi:hypothetical protein
MNEYRLEKAVIPKDDHMRVYVHVQKYVESKNILRLGEFKQYPHWEHVTSFVEFVLPPGKIARFFGDTYAGKCKNAMDNLVKQANEHIKKMNEADEIIKEVLGGEQ